MKIENIFEDLEAQFEAAQNVAIPQLINEEARLAEAVDLQLVNHALVAPILGANFIAGLDKTLPIWNILPFANVRKIAFSGGNEPSLPKARATTDSLIDHLLKLKLPTAGQWQTLGESALTSANIMAVESGLIILASEVQRGVIGVPINQLAHLKILSVDNFGTNS